MKTQDPHLEKKVLSYLLTDEDSLRSVERLEEEDFHGDARTLFKIVEWYAQKYKSILSESAFETIVEDELDKESEKSAIRSLFVELRAEECEKDFEFTLDQLKEVSRAAKVSKILENSADDLAREKAVDDVARNILLGMQDVVGHAGRIEIDRGYVWERVKERYKQYKAMRESDSHLEGISTGIDALDENVGGLQPKTAILFFGKSGVGKSRVMINITYNVARQGHHAIYFSREMGRELLEKCVDSRDALLDFQEISRGQLSKEKEKLYKIKLKEQHGRKDPFYVVDVSKGVTTGTISAEIDRYIQMTGHVPDLVSVDYLNLIDPQQKWSTTSERYGYVGEEIHDMAKFYNTAFITATQLNKRASYAKEVDEGHIYGSHYILPHFEVGILLEQDEADAVNGVLRCIPRKGRYSSKDEFELFVNWPLNFVGNYSDLVDGDPTVVKTR